jgi:hypothetical protein
MTIINILDDGTVYPPLGKQDLVIRVLQGQISVGKFDRYSFVADAGNYLKEPGNATDLKADVIALINAEMPGLFGKKEAVYIICPEIISQKAKWIADPAANDCRK